MSGLSTVIVLQGLEHLKMLETLNVYPILLHINLQCSLQRNIVCIPSEHKLVCRAYYDSID